LTTSSSATVHVPRPVKTRQILAVLQEMSRNPTAQFVRNCSLYEKVMLAAVVRGVRKLGVGELEWGKVRYRSFFSLSS
jgi:origin recognition complex subunit 1